MRLGPLGVALTAALASRVAGAQPRGSDRLPVPLRARPLTLPADTVAVDGSLALHREPTRAGSLFAALAVGAAWSPSDDVELSVIALPLALSPDLAFGVATGTGFSSDASAGIRWRLTRGRAQVGFGLRGTFRVADDLVFGVEPTVPFQVSVGRSRFDVSLGARVELGASVRSELSARGRYLLQVTPQLALAMFAAAVLYDLGDDARVPVGLSGAYTIVGARGAPAVDVSLSLEFDRLYDAATASARVDLYTVTGAARFYAR